MFETEARASFDDSPLRLTGQELSPLDQFKARGKELNRQLKGDADYGDTRGLASSRLSIMTTTSEYSDFPALSLLDTIDPQIEALSLQSDSKNLSRKLLHSHRKSTDLKRPTCITTRVWTSPTSELSNQYSPRTVRRQKDSSPVSLTTTTSSEHSHGRSVSHSTPAEQRRSTLRATKVSPTSIERLSALPDHALGAAEHIELGIEQHEQNQLHQSTHHFRVAADMNDPTGCMMYGLCLRHGWGCRVDLPKSLRYLTQAADSSITLDRLRQSKHLKVSLEDVAIAVYELGVSYQNGWGVEADKKASLKYFELAASWGDTEAMMAAADSYLAGRGCTKNKFRAAQLLRQAEGKGRKEVGNAWIWKDKYNT